MKLTEAKELVMKLILVVLFLSACGVGTNIDCKLASQLAGVVDPYTEPCGSICIIPGQVCCENQAGDYYCPAGTTCNSHATSLTGGCFSH